MKVWVAMNRRMRSGPIKVSSWVSTTSSLTYPLRDELAMLRDAGFARPDCFWKHGPIAVYGAYR